MMSHKTKHYWLLLPVLAALLLASCSKSDSYASPLQGKSVADMTFGSDEEMKQVSISGVDPYSVEMETDRLWCIAGVRGGKMLVMVLENSNTTARKATVRITDPEDGTTVSFGVTQQGRQAE